MIAVRAIGSSLWSTHSCYLCLADHKHIFHSAEIIHMVPLLISSFIDCVLCYSLSNVSIYLSVESVMQRLTKTSKTSALLSSSLFQYKCFHDCKPEL